MNCRTQLLAFVVLCLGTAATAQEACPGGTQVGQNCGGGYCVPICAYDESSHQTTAPPPRIVERWEVFEDRFGAIALASNGIYATTSGRPSQEDAERSALALCTERGGEDCQLRGVGVIRNSCATLAWGAGLAMVDGGATQEISERKAVQGCEEEVEGPCKVIETTCSEPISHWVYEKPDNFVPAR